MVQDKFEDETLFGLETIQKVRKIQDRHFLDRAIK